MNDYLKEALVVNSKTDDELNKERAKIFDDLLGQGIDPNIIVRLSAIDTELAIRGFKKELSKSIERS